MINGDNPRAFGQDIWLFGKKKGTGESVWDLRKQMGLFSMDIQRLYPSKGTVGQAVLSGFYDTLGLYDKPTGFEIQLMRQWLNLPGIPFDEDRKFSDLNPGEQRLSLLIRSLVKHPPLLLLDEPLLDLDDQSASLMAQLINLAAKESQSTLIYVSHREEPSLHAPKILELERGKQGSRGIIRNG